MVYMHFVMRYMDFSMALLRLHDITHTFAGDTRSCDVITAATRMRP